MTHAPSSVPTATSRQRRGWRPLRSLREQFTLVIALLAFLPNFGLTLISSSQLTWATLSWMLLVGLISGGIGYVLSGALLRPLHRLEQEVSANDFDQLHRDDPREIRALRRTFTGLMSRLGTEQARRNAFMATLVHDLKTPLIATGHLTHALTNLPLPEAERRDVGNQIQAETQRLLLLVQQMADAHRFERDDIQLDCTGIELSEILEKVARRLRHSAEARGITVRVCGDGEAYADAPALERAIGNLTENALRYAKTTVVLSASDYAVRVQDDGPGLSAPLEELAQPFNSQPALIAGQQYTAGTAGLGLFIVRRIAEAHGGTLDYGRDPPANPADAQTADAQTDYTTFTLTLPEVAYENRNR